MSKTIKAFLDSNVILSGFLSDKGAPRIILDLFSIDLPFLISITGEYNIIEIERNLINKLPGAVSIYKEYFPKLNLKIIPLPNKQDVKKYSGIISPKDAPVLASAVKSKANYLVTGDKDFIKVKENQSFSIKIVSPGEFLSKIWGHHT